MARLSSLRGCPDWHTLAAALWRSLKRTGHQQGFSCHSRATYGWICAAQDATPDGGVAGWYHLLEGWSSSYPETTGYLVPTMLAYEAATGTPQAKERALQMTEWEADVQLETGAVRSGLIDSSSAQAPAVFNTGQVLSGWAAYDRSTGGTRYEEPAVRAARWLLSIQNADGAWRRHLSALTTTAVQTYNVRTAWALAEAGSVYGEPRWTKAARRNAAWALEQQKDGWYTNCVFHPREAPLLHTLAYVVEGLLGLGLLLEEERYIASARRAIDVLLARFHRSGRFAGRYGNGWQARSRYRCPTGEAQIALALFRLSAYLGDETGYRPVGAGIVTDLCRLQDLNPRRTGTCGGLSGSLPVWAEYCSYSYINWTAKFHLDSLLISHHGVDPHDGSTWPEPALAADSTMALRPDGDTATTDKPLAGEPTR